MASRYAVAPSIVAGSCPVHRSTGSMVLRIKRTTAPSPPASQSPCRTLRPAAAGASAPTACDTIGPTARTIPMPMIAKKKKTVCPSATPASASGPKRPTITVSTKLIEMCASWAATTGPARRRVARNSRYRAAENTEVADRENAWLITPSNAGPELPFVTPTGRRARFGRTSRSQSSLSGVPERTSWRRSGVSTRSALRHRWDRRATPHGKLGRRRALLLRYPPSSLASGRAYCAHTVNYCGAAGPGMRFVFRKGQTHSTRWRPTGFPNGRTALYRTSSTARRNILTK